MDREKGDKMLLEGEKRMAEGRGMKRMRSGLWERPNYALEGSRTVMPGASGYGVTRQVRQVSRKSV